MGVGGGDTVTGVTCGGSIEIGKTKRSSSSSANRLAKMNEHECESDEDCEVYFLKPVNEYNIVDKIKEANKQLFAADEDNTAADAENNATNRKVTFALNLEDYEPAAADGGAPATSLDKDEAEEVDALQLKLLTDFKFPAIDEEPTMLDEDDTEPTTLEVKTEIAGVNDNSEPSENHPLECTKMPQDADVVSSNLSKPKSFEIVDDVVEEICEEIVVMDMEENGDSQAVASDSKVANQRRICKQATFDHDEEQSDNRSLTNLLTSDGEEEFGLGEEPLADDNVDDNDGEDDDEDDNLSIIVASYIPDDYDNASLTSNDKLTATTTERSYSASRKHKRFFNKRFSFRRTGGASNNATGACSKHIPPPEVTDLKLTYKTCCEYRHAVQEKLPKYTGYLSEYGLSSEQLARRHEKLQQKHRSVLTATLKANEQDMRKMHDNERAFTSWLRNKMRFPINKTRNMFDVKKMGMTTGCVGGGCSAARNRNLSSGMFK